MKKPGNILIVDDNRGVLTAVQLLLKPHFEKIITLTSPVTLTSVLREETPSVVLLDMNFTSGINTGNEGLFWLQEIKRLRPSLPVVLFTAYGDIDLAVRGIKEGATDFIVKPWDNQKLVETLLNAVSASETKSPANGPNAGRTAESSHLFADTRNMYWGNSPAMQQLRLLVEKVASTDANILITGENGTGKEMLAREIHSLSPRNRQEMVSVDMGAVTESLFESELFGHMKGSFTDAHADRAGKFEAASRSTLFLDEIGNLSYEVQIQLLRALQERKIRPVGSNKEITVDVRLVSATNEDLEQAIEKGAFRQDLYHRINEFTLRMPELKDRREDILLFANFFLDQANRELDKQLIGFDDAASRTLLEYHWPGNLRQMKNVVRRATLLAQDQLITLKELTELQQITHPHVGLPLRNEEAEKHQIIEALRQTGNNKSRAAQLLGIDRKTLYNKLKLYEIES